jgi:hypothetical protein
MMAELVASFMADLDVPLVAPAALPTIRVRRIDTQALVVTDVAMVEVGEGEYSFDLTTDPVLEYSWRANGDPTSTGQTITGGQFVFGTASGVADHILDACHLGVTYDGVGTLSLDTWLVRDDLTVTPISTTVTWFDDAGVLQFTAVSAVVDAQDHIVLSQAFVMIANTNYYAIVSITDTLGTVVTHRAVPFTA